jgi:actin related protein 2/3 complex subunit 3
MPFFLPWPFSFPFFSSKFFFFFMVPLNLLAAFFLSPSPLWFADKPDIIDETLDLFKANILFRNFEVKGPADRTLIYITLYISQCLGKIAGQNKGTAEKTLYQLAIENFALPGDKAFALGGIVTNPANRGESGKTQKILFSSRFTDGVFFLLRFEQT